MNLVKRLTEAAKKVASLRRQLREAQEERDRWAEAATIQNDEIQACLVELERAGWRGPASPGIEWLKAERDAAIKRAEAAEALAEKRRQALVLAYANIGQENWAKMTDAAKNTIINA